MRRIRINEKQYRYLIGETHHSFDNGLEQDAANIAREMCDKYGNNTYHFDVELAWENREVCVFQYQINAFGEPFILWVYIWNGNGNALKSLHQLLIGKGDIKKAIETGDISHLTQTVYHELGHLTNAVLSDNFVGQANRDFRNPMFLSMNDTEYNEITKALYRFLSRELKARCFETTMFIKLNKDKGITLQDVYDNRCSDITLMRNFIEKLKTISENGEENDKNRIINNLYRDCILDKGYGKINAPWENKCQKLIYFFSNKLNWLKKRVDKIFYDLTSS